ncbi:phospholipid transport system transporter-binding protein [Marinobacter sp. LV10R510-11A]|uniref:STAS domain-containing protein n=1 Tax=Marinobacter sp. LV10R510-11A TaxID=1415568 RepID=UPI000BB7509E|nr:STAS domain-containing protein [Marinobacter sp. LV10R510-11A]SOB78431.1 phospholipid transport system transporter-binding protein [Marinobacter sp. LV10R510-11A]
MSAEAPSVQLKQGVLLVSGAIDVHTVISLRAEGERLIKTASESPKSLVVNLQGLSTTLSAVLSMLLCWSRLAKKQGISLSFAEAPERLVSLAALSNLEDWLQSRP